MRGSASHSTVSTKKSPVRTSSVTAGRAVRLRSVSQSVVISAVSAARAACRSRGSRSGSSRRCSVSEIRCSLDSTVRRLASVGWAVSTSSMCSRASSPAICSDVTPAAFNRATASPTESAIGLRMLGALALPECADALRLLGEVHQVEVDGEGGGGGAGRRGRQRGDLGRQAGRGFAVAGAPRLREPADLLLGREQRGRFLLAQHPAQRVAQQADRRREIQGAA